MEPAGLVPREREGFGVRQDGGTWCVPDLVGLGCEALALDEAAQGLGVAEDLVQARGDADAGAQFPLVVAAGDGGHLAGALEVDVLAQAVGVGEQSLPEGLGDEAIETGVLSPDLSFLLEGLAQGELIVRHGRRQGARSLGLDPRRVESVILTVPLVLVHAHRGLEQLADGGGQQGSDEGHVGEGRGGNRIGPVFVVQLLQPVGILQPEQKIEPGL